MIYSITNDQPFQVLSTNFSVSPSESGYNLQISANGIDYTDFATVGAGVTRQFTGMANGNFYRLSGNTGTVEVNWMRECSPAGGGGAAGVSSLDGQTGALTTKTIGGQSILGEGDIPVGGGGGDYMIVEDLSAITNPTDGMIAYVPAHTETYTGYTISNADGNLYGQVYLKHYNPREHRMMLYEQYDEGFLGVTEGQAAWSFGGDDNFKYIYRGQIALKYDNENKLFTVLYKPGVFELEIYVSQEYYTPITGTTNIPAQMYIYKYGDWHLYEDGKISYYLSTITEAEYDAMYLAIPQMSEGEVQFIVDDYHYGWSTYRFQTNTSIFSNGSFYGYTFDCKASNGETFDNIDALSIRVGWSSGYKGWYFAKYSLLPSGE